MEQRKSRAGEIMRLLRPNHWIKNVLVAVAAFFGGKPDFEGVALAFVCMCLAASGVYALNDWRDAPRDRLHPVKRLRPVASGSVSGGMALVIASLCMGLPLLMLVFMGRPAAAGILTVYVAMNLAYSVAGAKNLAIVDVTIVAMGFVLRVLFGAAITGVRVSNWLLLTVLMGSYYMAVGKRRNELRDMQGEDQTRAVLRHYSYAYLNAHMYLFLALTIAFYSLWSVDVNTVELAVVTVPLVVILAMRYNLVIEGEGSGDPVEVVLHDGTFLGTLALYAAIIFYLLYIGGGSRFDGKNRRLGARFARPGSARCDAGGGARRWRICGGGRAGCARRAGDPDCIVCTV